ncbi:hypothetical protein C8R44DRAFT_876701 [Mycena epipterygia]|nr:hypothetical protein C8R44DRAFT_876701 [Mycena epipterygia]
MTPHMRRVDRPTTQRTVPVQVFALGFSRTGMASMKIALETLRYVRTNHGFNSFFNPEEINCNVWIPAIKAKFYEEVIPYGWDEWDRLLGDCQDMRAIMDVPHILFAEELIAAYPDTKVVLTNRDPDSWWKSYHATIGELHRLRLQENLNAWLDPQFSGSRREFRHLVWPAMFKTEHITEEIAKACFIAYYEEVRPDAAGQTTRVFRSKKVGHRCANFWEKKYLWRSGCTFNPRPKKSTPASPVLESF